MNYLEAQEAAEVAKKLKDEITEIVTKCIDMKKQIKVFGTYLRVELYGSENSIRIYNGSGVINSLSLSSHLRSGERTKSMVESFIPQYFYDVCSGFGLTPYGGAFDIQDGVESGFVKEACKRICERYDDAIENAIRVRDVSNVTFTAVVSPEDVVRREGKTFMEACVMFASEIKEVIENDGWAVPRFDLVEMPDKVAFKVYLAPRNYGDVGANWLDVKPLQRDGEQN